MNTREQLFTKYINDIRPELEKLELENRENTIYPGIQIKNHGTHKAIEIDEQPKK